MKHLFAALLFLVLISLNACSSNRASSLSPISGLSTKNPAKNATSVIDLKKLTTLDSITPRLAKSRTVFVGEMHTSFSDHQNQLKLIQNLHGQWGKNISIGLEMVQQPYQSYLDDYIAGKINEREMLAGIEWYKRWMYDFRLYRPIFDYAKKNQIPLVALNIPKELTHRITKVGIKGLSKKERLQLPAFIDRSNKDYTKRITSVFGMHSKTKSKGVSKFLDAQLAWDEGMAYAAARYLKKHPQKKMVLIAGGGHVISGEGIPSRLDRMLGTKSKIVLNNAHGALKTSHGDFLLDSPEQKLPTIGRIGIIMESANPGVKVIKVSKHGAAKKAGIKKNDIFLKLNNKVMQNALDVRLFLEKTKPNDAINITLKRNNKLLVKPIKLGGKPKSRFSMHKK